ncbi:hypothetical protein BDN70DRAFT_995554 [Pholiota conissans]|uniref:Uncharacterized protein n=1 Tax=Pholiota conissans TaxID=109636 RepID=A0A9P6CXH4_9AGAR|nr:hypothetical protein BDN70DRAFT_995554 [Pholiota conissans]
MESLGTAITLLKRVYDRAEDVKVYKGRCEDLKQRCSHLVSTLKADVSGLEGSRVVHFAHEVEGILQDVEYKVTEWSLWSPLKSFYSLGQIKEGLDNLEKEINFMEAEFSEKLGIEMFREQRSLVALQERDHLELVKLMKELKTFVVKPSTVKTVSVPAKKGVDTNEKPKLGTAKPKADTVKPKFEAKKPHVGESKPKIDASKPKTKAPTKVPVAAKPKVDTATKGKTGAAPKPKDTAKAKVALVKPNAGISKPKIYPSKPKKVEESKPKTSTKGPSTAPKEEKAVKPKVDPGIKAKVGTAPKPKDAKKAKVELAKPKVGTPNPKVVATKKAAVGVPKRPVGTKEDLKKRDNKENKNGKK